MTDEELRKEILQRVYNRGARYVAKDANGEIYAYENKPSLDALGYWKDMTEDLNSVIVELTYFDDVFPDLRMCIETLLDISKELKILDWGAVEINTKVLVSNDCDIWYRRHFFKYMPSETAKYWTYAKGQTSWSCENLPEFWEYCKLAEKSGGKTMREYLVDLCNYIDYLFTLVFLVCFIRWLFGYDVDTSILIVSVLGVLLWPNKKYWAKWLIKDKKEQDDEY